MRPFSLTRLKTLFHVMHFQFEENHVLIPTLLFRFLIVPLLIFYVIFQSFYLHRLLFDNFTIFRLYLAELGGVWPDSSFMDCWRHGGKIAPGRLWSDFGLFFDQSDYWVLLGLRVQFETTGGHEVSIRVIVLIIVVFIDAPFIYLLYFAHFSLF